MNAPSNMKALQINTYPTFVRDLIASRPRRGQGLNLWFFRTAMVLHRYLPAAAIVQLLAAITANESVRGGEIERAVARSRATAPHPNPPTTPRLLVAKWPAINRQQRDAVVREGGGLVDLWEKSPVRLEDNESHTEEIIDVSFPGNPLLCVAQRNSEFTTKPREELRGSLSGMQLIAPSPMIARIGHTQEGKESEHTLENTGPRRFLVIEQDEGTDDEQAAVLLDLAAFAPLTLAVHSGSKSIHGWFYCHGQPEERLREFMRYAVSLGADRATWTRSQFVRMPDGTRDNGLRQTVYFFNPEVIR